MLRRIPILVACALIGLGSAMPAAADECCRGFYVGFEGVGGWGMVDDVKNTGTIPGQITDDSYEDSVAGGGLSFGYDFSYHFDASVRVEGEFLHIVRLDADTPRPLFQDGTLPGAGVQNDLSIRTLMVNAFYDWDLGTWYTPHVGFGVGYARNNSNATLTDFNSTRANQAEEVETAKNNIAWSLMAGVQFDITDNWFADMGYRYLDAGELVAGPFTNGFRIEADDITVHELMLDFGYRF